MSKQAFRDTSNPEVNDALQDVYKLINEMGTTLNKLTGGAGSQVLSSVKTKELEYSVSFKPRIYRQSTEPNIPNNSVGFWIDTDDSKNYLILDDDGTQKKIELT